MCYSIHSRWHLKFYLQYEEIVQLLEEKSFILFIKKKSRKFYQDVYYKLNNL